MTLTEPVMWIDSAAFARTGGQREGLWPVERMERLAAEAALPVAGREARWAVQGQRRSSSAGAGGAVSRDAAGHRPVLTQDWLLLSVDAVMPLVCQRCLQPVEVPLVVRRDFRFVADEAQALAEDDEAEEDLLVADAHFDLAALIEDELLLALPLVPTHADCTAPAVASSPADAPRAHPFAVLAGLRPGGAGRGRGD